MLSGDGFIARIYNSTFNGNTGSGLGTGLFIDSYAVVTVAASEISGNKGPSSTGVYVNSATVSMTESRVANNVASSGDGGGIGMSLSTVRLKHTIISSNTASGNGGGIFASEESTVVLRGVNITENHALLSGGGVHVTGESLLYASTSCSFSILTMDFEESEKDDSDAAWVCLTRGDETTKLGGQLPLVDAMGSSLCPHANIGALESFTMCLGDGPWTAWATDDSMRGWSGGSWELTDVLAENIAFGDLARLTGNNMSTFNLGHDTGSTTVIGHNQAGTYGGGVFLDSETSGILVQTSVVGNAATENGGGIYANYQSDVGIYACGVHQNYAGGKGGAVFAFTLVTVAVNMTQFTMNSAAVYGGACYFSHILSANIWSAVFENNTAKSGGALAYSDCSVGASVVDRSDFVGNRVADEGRS